MAVPLHAFVVFFMLSWWKLYFLMHWFAANTSWQKYQPSYKFMLQNNEDQKKETGRKYTLYCGVTKVPSQIRPVIHLQPLLYPGTGTPSKRSVTLSWKKPLLYGDNVQMYTVIYLLFLFVPKLVDTWENQSPFSKAGRARWYRYCCKQLLARLVYCALCCLKS